MLAYSDGRKAIGYRFQNYIETIAFQKSNKNILELGQLNPEDHYKLTAHTNKN